MSLTPQAELPRVCFIAHFAYGALTGGGQIAHIGGIERQQTMMARWLAARGWRVSIVTWDEDQGDGDMIDGVRVLKMCRWKAGLPGLRFLHPRWTSLNAAMRRADADVYYQNCGECVTGQVDMWCRRHGRAFVYSVANDSDCDPTLYAMTQRRDRVLYRYGLARADSVIVQTQRQADMLKDGFGRDSTVIPMPCSDNLAVDPSMAASFGSNRVIWVGRICDQKRPEMLVELARALPQFQFELIGPHYDKDLARRVRELASGLSNFSMPGAASREQMRHHYRDALCLCCTSRYEGFPNTFLEAWSQGLPVVTTFDPDGIVARCGLGAAGSDVRQLADGIAALAESPQRWRQASDAARQYYVSTHAVETVMPQFERAFIEAHQLKTQGTRK